MTAHLLLLCHASTAATRTASFPAEESVDAPGRQQMASLLGRLAYSDRCLTSPARSARETSDGLGLAAVVEPALADCDFGRWRGLSLAQVRECAPRDLATWMQDPASAPHGGESIIALMTRVRAWLHAPL